MSDPKLKPVLWIVDDSPLERAAARRALVERYDVEEFVDGSEVIERLDRTPAPPKLLLLDWVMPNVGGDEVCRYVRAHDRLADLPIILFTASRVETEDIVQGLALGANDYVPKPFAAEELRARVHAVLRGKEHRDAASRERTRLAAINGLGRALFSAGPDLPKILHELVSSLQGVVADGCAIIVLPGDLPPFSAAVHRDDPNGRVLASIATLADPMTYAFESSEAALAQLPPLYHPYIKQFGLRGLAILPFPVRNPVQGVVTLTRDGDSAPFDHDDLAAIETCIEYAGLAVQNAVRYETERTAKDQLVVIATERERVAAFQEQMLGIVGHDLRNPLSAMMTGAEIIIARTADHPEIRSVAVRMQSSTRRMSSIVNQLLDVTRARLGDGIPLMLTRVSLGTLLESVLDEARAAFPQATFELVVAGEVTGTWDADRLAQVFSNLVGNAVQYGAPAKPIRIAASPAADERAIITVTNALRDSPIPADRLAALFDPYKRGEGSAIRHRGGLGLGLYISHEIVVAHKGTIRAASSLDGTVFTVELPLES